MNEFDKCRFCLSYDEEAGGCTDISCWSRYHYRIDVDKIINKSREKGISVTDVLNLIRECDEE